MQIYHPRLGFEVLSVWNLRKTRRGRVPRLSNCGMNCRAGLKGGPPPLCIPAPLLSNCAMNCRAGRGLGRGVLYVLSRSFICVILLSALLNIRATTSSSATVMRLTGKRKSPSPVM